MRAQRIRRLAGVVVLLSVPAIGWSQQSCPSTISISYEHTSGLANATVTIGGTCSNASFDWRVLNGGTAGGSVTCPSAGPCSINFSFPAHCFADGSHAVTMTSFCGFTDANGNCNAAIGSGQTSFSTDQHPHVNGLAATQTTTPAIFHCTANYEFPGTTAAQERNLVVTGTDPNGKRYTFFDSLSGGHSLNDESGVASFDIDAECFPDGTTNLLATAAACNGDADSTTGSFTVNHRPSAGLALLPNADGTYTASVSYSFPDTNAPQDRALTLQILPTPREAGGTLAEWGGGLGTPLSAAGTVQSNPIAVESRRVLRLVANSCQDQTTQQTAIDTNCCPANQQGDPVQLSDGTMIYTERDPLPDDLGLIFRRVYKSTHSQNDTTLRFGMAWFSAFDAAVLPFDTTGHKTVIVYTEDDSHAVFDQKKDGTWLQVWPTGHAALGTLSGSESAGYSYREPGSSVTRLYGGAGNHRLIGFRDSRTNQKVTITYDPAGLPARVFDESGRWSCSVTTSAGLVTQIAVDGRPDLAWNYAYAGRYLATVTLAGAPAPWRSYEYDKTSSLPDFFYLARVKDSLGNILEQHSYDANGRALSSLGPSGDITSIQYSRNGTSALTTLLTRADGSVSTYRQSFVADHDAITRVEGGCASCGGHDSTYAFDAFGHITRVQDGRGYVTESLYDPTGQHLLSVTRAMAPAGCDPATAADRCLLSSADLAAASLLRTAASNTVRYSYNDPNWPERPTQVERESVVAPGQFSSEVLTFDPSSGATLTDSRSGFTGAGQLESHVTTSTLYNGTEAAAFNPGGAFQSGWLSLPQPQGLLKSVDGPRSDAADITTYVYYPNDASVPGPWHGRLAAIRNAAGHLSRFEDYDVFGHAAATTDANGVVTRFTFDALGRIIGTTVKGLPGCDTSADPLCATDLTSTNQYANVTGPLLSTTSANGNSVVYAYDGRGRVASMSRGPSPNDLREQLETTYDAATQQKSLLRYLANIGGAWTEKRRESYAYDSVGRLATVAHADGTSVRYGYDPADNLTSVQDERHTTPNIAYSYDPAKRLAAVQQTLSGAPGGHIVTAYAYDAQDNLASVTDPNGNVTRYVFDDFARMLRQVSAVTGTTSYSYDPAGNLTNTTDANGATVTRTFDALNRVLSANATRGAWAETVSWTWDDIAAGNFGLGRLASMSDPSGSTTYRYERRGLLTREQKSAVGATYTSTYRYDADGNRNSLTYPSGRSIAYSFDYADRPSGVAAGATPIVSSVAYLPFGPQTAVVFANGTTKSTQFDSRYRPRRNTLTTAAGTIADYMYDADGAQNITQIHDALDPAYDRDFAYDDLNRLVAANSGAALWGTGSYAYDGMGNLRSMTLGTSRAVTFSYSGSTPKLAGVAENGVARAVAYDDAGNETASGSVNYTYSPRNLLDSAANASYGYDGRGVRVIANVPLAIQSFSVDPASVTGGSSARATISLNASAPPGGALVTLTATPPLSAPATLTISAGSSSTAFSVSTTPVAAQTSGSVTASLGSSSRTVGLTVIPPVLAALTMTPSAVSGGSAASALLTLSGPAPAGGIVATIVANSGLATVPASATVQAGNSSTTFSVATSAVSQPSTVLISATAGGRTQSATLTVNPPALTAVTVSPSAVIGGDDASLTITLGSPAPAGGALITVASDRMEVGVPASLMVPAAATSATVRVSTTRVTSTTIATVSASYGGVTTTATLTLNPLPVALASLSVTPATVVGGLPVTGTLTLTAPAPASGVIVTLASDDPSVASTPSAATIASGALSVTFPITTTTILTAAQVRISGTFNGISQSAVLAVQPPSSLAVFSLVVDPPNVVGGSTTRLQPCR